VRLLDRYVIHNETQAQPLCSCVHIADSFLPRLIGLLGRAGLEVEEGLWIRPSSGVHTFGMRFPIDVVALDRSMRVTGTWADVSPWRVCGLSLKTASVLELAAGRIQTTKLQVGDQLSSRPWTEG
jgi:uncharacterized membrane protein (UPF0127 family)